MAGLVCVVRLDKVMCVLDIRAVHSELWHDEDYLMLRWIDVSWFSLHRSIQKYQYGGTLYYHNPKTTGYHKILQ